MKFEEIKINEIYEVWGVDHQVVHKHYESKTVFTIEVGSDDPEGWAEGELNLFSPIALPETGLLVSKSGSIVYRTGERSGYGFNGGEIWYDNNLWIEFTPDRWRKATPEDEKEFRELSIKEAAKHGLVDGVKFECLIHGGFIVDFNTDELVFNRHGIILDDHGVSYKGKWATPIENKKQDEFDSTIEKLFELGRKLGVGVTLIIDGKNYRNER